MTVYTGSPDLSINIGYLQELEDLRAAIDRAAAWAWYVYDLVNQFGNPSLAGAKAKAMYEKVLTRDGYADQINGVAF